MSDCQCRCLSLPSRIQVSRRTMLRSNTSKLRCNACLPSGYCLDFRTTVLSRFPQQDPITSLKQTLLRFCDFYFTVNSSTATTVEVSYHTIPLSFSYTLWYRSPPSGGSEFRMSEIKEGKARKLKLLRKITSIFLINIMLPHLRRYKLDEKKFLHSVTFI